MKRGQAPFFIFWGFHWERSAAISYGKNVLARFFEILSLCSEQAWQSRPDVMRGTKWRGNLVKRKSSLIFLWDCHAPLAMTKTWDCHALLAMTHGWSCFSIFAITLFAMTLFILSLWMTEGSVAISSFLMSSLAVYLLIDWISCISRIEYIRG